MSIHMQRDLMGLRKQLLELGALVEESIARAVQALLARDMELAERVMQDDSKIDEAEIAIEDLCLKILALNQPVAHDLRFLVTALKLNSDLEAIGDLSSNIAKRARWLAKRPEVPWPQDIAELAIAVKQMVNDSLDALVDADSAKAREIIVRDETINELKKENVDGIREQILTDSDHALTLLKMMDVPRHLERIADMAANIAKDIIYMVEGEIVRHREINGD